MKLDLKNKYAVQVAICVLISMTIAFCFSNAYSNRVLIISVIFYNMLFGIGIISKKYRDKLNGYGVTFIVWMVLIVGLILSTISLSQ